MNANQWYQRRVAITAGESSDICKSSNKSDNNKILMHHFKLQSYIFFILYASISNYEINDKDGIGRTFEGIGAISGGGATSKLLVGYPKKQLNEILDFLFLPNYGASLQIFKVEIGGDAQSTDGTESSHMHEEWDENYERGYEWFLMVEAKKRNPDIKLYGLAWAYPAWVGKGSNSPYQYPDITSMYLIKWLQGAKKYYNLTIDYLGIWNERNYDITFVKTLRKSLDSSGFGKTQLVVGDGDWSPANDALTDYSFFNSFDIIGAHYPGTQVSANAVVSGKSLWASEDYSTYNNNVGAGCWARILNQNYVNGLMTSTIAWNLIASYYENLPFGKEGLMTAMEPWSGHYVVEAPIWITAHTTQFTSIGWKYLKHGRGVGKFDKGGSYVTLISPDSKDFTIVIETMTRDQSVCIRPDLPEYNVTAQQVEFQLDGSLLAAQKLYVWKSQLGPYGHPDDLFVLGGTITPVDGYFTIALGLDQVLTLTTLTKGVKGIVNDIPDSVSFPDYYFEDYEVYPLYSEAYNFAPQNGVWEIFLTSDPLHNQVNRQVIRNDPIKWCLQNMLTTLNIAGDYNRKNVEIKTDFYIPLINGTNGVFVAARINNGGCNSDTATGVFFFVYPANKTFYVSDDINRKHNLIAGQFLDTEILPNSWHSISLYVDDDKGTATIDGVIVGEVFNIPSQVQQDGFVGYGTTSLGVADFDNTLMQSIKPLHFLSKNKKYHKWNIL